MILFGIMDLLDREKSPRGGGRPRRKNRTNCIPVVLQYTHRNENIDAALFRYRAKSRNFKMKPLFYILIKTSLIKDSVVTDSEINLPMVFILLPKLHKEELLNLFSFFFKSKFCD